MEKTGHIILFVASLAVATLHHAKVSAADFYVSNPVEFQAALNSAADNNTSDTIHVDSGTYDISRPLRYQVDSSEENLTIIASDPDHPPILNGLTSCWQTIKIITHTSSATGHSNDKGLQITLDGLVIQHSPEVVGTGVYINTFQADIIIQNCLIQNNFVSRYIDWDRFGGGLSIDMQSNGHVTISNSTFLENSTEDNEGGGALLTIATGASCVIRDNTFLNNDAVIGGGLYLYETGNVELSIINNNFFHNSSQMSGGGLYIENIISGKIMNNIFSSNFSPRSSGAHIISHGTIIFSNNTVFENTASINHGGVTIDLDNSSSEAYIYNNIFWNNTATSTGVVHLGEDLYINSDELSGNDVTCTLKYNDLGINSNFATGYSEDLYITNTQYYQHSNNITVDPRLDPEGHLSEGTSVLINTGLCGYYHMTPFGFEYVRVAPYDDFEGDNRPGDGTVLGCDIGADEYYAPQHFYWPMFLPAIIRKR